MKRELEGTYQEANFFSEIINRLEKHLDRIRSLFSFSQDFLYLIKTRDPGYFSIY